MQIFKVFQEIIAVTAYLNTQLKGFKTKNQQLGDTPMSFFLETPVKRNMSKVETAEITGMLTEVLESLNLEINELKTETKESLSPSKTTQ